MKAVKNNNINTNTNTNEIDNVPNKAGYNNVTPLFKTNTEKDNKPSAPQVLSSVLDEVGMKSYNTRKSYYHFFNQLVSHMFNKTNETITWEELESITYADMLNYRKHLVETNSSVSINSKIAGIKVIMKEMNKQSKKIDTDAFDLRKMPTHEDSNTYGSFTEEEMNNLFSYSMSLPLRQKNAIKTAFFKTAYVTAIRVGALLSLKMNQVSIVNENKPNQYALIETRDKGKSVKTSIPMTLYNEILKARRINRVKPHEERVFPITEKTARRTLSEYCEQYDIDQKGRNLVLHSIKKASIDKVFNETGDINLTARHGKHNSLDMVYEVYQGKNDQPDEQASLNIFDDRPIDTNDLEQLSKEELLELISKSGGSTVNKLKKLL